VSESASATTLCGWQEHPHHQQRAGIRKSGEQRREMADRRDSAADAPVAAATQEATKDGAVLIDSGGRRLKDVRE
jgi:hypothetical protein